MTITVIPFFIDFHFRARFVIDPHEVKYFYELAMVKTGRGGHDGL